jgi:hypothetical protein
MTRKQVLEYARLIWGRMAETGEKKRDAINDLIDEGVLPEDASLWLDLCPFCEEYQENRCSNCPWPGGGFLRCNNVGSPFERWVYSRGVADDMDACREVYDLICKMS